MGCVACKSGGFPSAVVGSKMMMMTELLSRKLVESRQENKEQNDLKITFIF